MEHNIELIKAEKKDKEILKHLWDLYSYDFSEYDNDDLQEDATYNFYYENHYFDSDERCIFLIYVDKKLAGFSSVSKSCYILNRPNDKMIVDFFIMKKFRMGGVGRVVAERIFDMYPSRWEVIQWENNEASVAFWQKVISKYTDNHYEIRNVFTNESTLKAIIFDSTKIIDYQPESKNIKEIGDGQIIKHYIKPDENTINQIVDIVKNNIGGEDKSILTSIRKDLKYQDAMALEDEDGIVCFIMFTSLEGEINITFIGIDGLSQKKGYASALLKVFKQRVKLNGFDKIVVKLPDPQKYENYKSTEHFYLKNDFKPVSADGEKNVYELILL
jgi:predicted acetyltransferase